MTIEGMTLDSLLQDLEKSASVVESKKDEDDEKAKADKAKAEAAKKEETNEDKGQEKSAAAKTRSDLANEVMEKIASKQNTQSNKGEHMNKQASEAGKALAQALLKQANLGDQATTNGIPEGVVPNKGQRDVANAVAEHASYIQSTPGTDGLGNGGTVNQIFDAIVADATSRGVKDEQQTGNTAQAEGAKVPAVVPNQVPTTMNGVGDDSQEKTAAVAHLVNSGMDFDSAVNLVKQASEQIEAEELAHVKQAAFKELLDKGISFSEAATMIKAASEKQNIDIEKQAALDALMQNGVDFDTALNLVETKAAEIYG